MEKTTKEKDELRVENTHMGDEKRFLKNTSVRYGYPKHEIYMKEGVIKIVKKILDIYESENDCIKITIETEPLNNYIDVVVESSIDE